VDHGQPTSYRALEAGTDVVTSDGSSVGTVEHVLADDDKDIFDGIVVDTKLGPGGLRFVDAEQVDEIFENAVVLKIAAVEVEELPKPGPSPAVMESHGVEDSEGPLEQKLRRAWDLISGNY
jgi:sporulation protein YlmC with PRC-barrel domain